MKPVRVSSYGRFAFRAIRPRREEETIDSAKVPCAPRATRWAASRAPTSSPRSIRQSSPSLTATAQRSASGSLAMTRSGSVSRALAKARSMAPGSSGLGKATVGKSGSGSACSVTRAGAGKPARSKAARRTSLPTPCIAV